MGHSEKQAGSATEPPAERHSSVVLERFRTVLRWEWASFGHEPMGEEADKLRKQVATLAKFGGQALRSTELGELLQEATSLVSEAIEVDLVKVLELLPDGQNLLVRAGVNWNPGVVGQATIPADGGSAAGHALRTKTPVISDIATEDRFSTPRLLLEHGVQSTVNVVIRGEKVPFGVLEVDSREHRSFGQDDIDFLQNYANLLASAVDRLNTHRELADSLKKQEVLLHELQHRVNNMLLTIRAVVRRTCANSSSLDEFVSALDDRLASLARAHDLLTQRESITICEILRQELSAVGAAEGENFASDGPEVLLPGKQAQLLSMLFHELATNAVKHGALSVKAGRIDVMWETDRRRASEQVRLCWRERGVMIERDPVKRGYGTEILERSIPNMLKGKFDRTFHADGIECVIEFGIKS